MSGTWADLGRELHESRSTVRSRGMDWDVADASEAVARWLGIPDPRHPLDAAPPVALQAAVACTLPHCLGCDGTCQ